MCIRDSIGFDSSKVTEQMKVEETIHSVLFKNYQKELTLNWDYINKKKQELIQKGERPSEARRLAEIDWIKKFLLEQYF